MVMDSPATPTKAQKERFLAKIQEWKELGFKTDDLEDLLDNDFDEFLRRRHQILKDQVELGDKPGLDSDSLEAEEGKIGAAEKEAAELESLPHELPAGADEITGTPEGEELLLLGEPLSPDEEPEVDIEEEGVIEVGKPPKTAKSKVHRAHEEVSDEEGAGEPTEAESDTEIIAEDEETELPEGEVKFEEEDEEEYEDELEGEEEEKIEPKKSRRGTEPEPSNTGRKIAAVAVVIIVILALYYFFWISPIGGKEAESVSAAFDIIPISDPYNPGSIIEFDASTSKGDDLKYQWVFDDDFHVTEGSLRSKILRGYYSATEKGLKPKFITLTVSNSDSKDTASKDISIEPTAFKIAEEKLGDHGEFKVDGYLDILNPDGIAKFSIEDPEANLEADVTINSVHVTFNTKDSKPMTLDFIDGDNINDGFQQSHSVYQRTLNQDLDLGGHASVMAKVKKPIPNDYLIYPEIDGTMETNDVSYADYQTHNILNGRATNDLEITINIEFGIYSRDYPFTSNDIMESYPDLQKNPMNLRLVDLAVDNLELGKVDSISVGNIIYSWKAEKIEYLYEKPVIKTNLTLNSQTMIDNNLQEFFLAFWIAEDISQPVKTHLYSVHQNKGNTTTLNYISLMTNFQPGNTDIANRRCDSSTSDGHFFERRPGHEYKNNNLWTYLPPTGSSNEIHTPGTSFDAFSHEQALVMAQNNQDLQDYLAAHSDCYIVSGNCSAIGDANKDIPAGMLAWDLTFGYHDPDDGKEKVEGLNLIIRKDGLISSELIEIDNPPNSHDDFEPLLTFASSEDIFLNYSGGIYNAIFNNDDPDRIDFYNVSYGVETNLQYPNLEITSIMFIEHSKYAYIATYYQQANNQQVIIALDGETGQLLFYWDHKDDGLTIF